MGSPAEVGSAQVQTQNSISESLPGEIMEERRVDSDLAWNEAHDDGSADVGDVKLQTNFDNESHGLSSSSPVLPFEGIICSTPCTKSMNPKNDPVEVKHDNQPPEQHGQVKQEGQFCSEGATISVTSNSVTEKLCEPNNFVEIVHECRCHGEIMSQGSQDGSSSCPKYVKGSSQYGGDAGKVVDKPSSPHLVENEIVYDSSLISRNTVAALSGVPSLDEQKIPSADDAMQGLTEQLKIPVEKMDEDAYRNLLKTQARKHKNSNKRGYGGKKAPKTSKKKYLLRSSLISDRALRSRTHEKSEELESNNKMTDGTCDGGKRSRGRKKRRPSMEIADEYSRIRKHLYYLLNRMSYERNLIEAYSSEGWKGLSIEKLKPERELQRATSVILRYKMKIRDLFHRLESLCAEGRLPEALFDSDGMIDSEDIFCARCGSKDLTADNDIILCDGVCERGFHQFCLEPPMLKEDIPPGDEGWLCPGCDCKLDCVDMLNKTEGTNISIRSSWEKVFPEVISAGNADANSGLPSDDSEDDDYDPDRTEVDKSDEGDESSSDGSEYGTIGSDKSKASLKNDPYLGLPSEDSEDDDYDPDGPNKEKIEDESSSSDFTSDSEDLTATLQDNGIQNDGCLASSSKDGIDTAKCGRQKKQTLNDELQSLIESDLSKDASTPIAAKRHVERLDYKKLYDEAYGNAISDSSADEDWTDAVPSRKKRKNAENAAAETLNGDTNVGHKKENSERTQGTPKRAKKRQKSPGTSNSVATPPSSSSKSVPTGGKGRPSTYKRLGEAVTERLHKVFKENQYPERAIVDNLAEELGVTSRQVKKWFENARWSYNHPSTRKASCVFKKVRSDGEPESIIETVTGNTNSSGAQDKQPDISLLPEQGSNIDNKTQGQKEMNTDADEQCKANTGQTNAKKQRRKSNT